MAMTDVIQSIGIVVTLVIAIWQMRIQTRQAQASADLALMAKFDEITRYYMEHPGLWDKLGLSFQSVDSTADREKLENLVYLVFNTLELAHQHHHKYGMLDLNEWRSWSNTLAIYISKPYVVGWWQTRASEYGQAFRQLVDQRLSAQGIDLKREAKASA